MAGTWLNSSVRSYFDSNESDLRFIYTSTTIAYILDDFSILNKSLITDYIVSCQNYDGGFGLNY